RRRRGYSPSPLATPSLPCRATPARLPVSPEDDSCTTPRGSARRSARAVPSPPCPSPLSWLLWSQSFILPDDASNQDARARSFSSRLPVSPSKKGCATGLWDRLTAPITHPRLAALKTPMLDSLRTTSRGLPPLEVPETSWSVGPR